MEILTLPEVKLRGSYEKSIDHVLDELARIELLLRAQVLRWRHSAVCCGSEQNWGMVTISEAEVDRYMNSEYSEPGIPPASVIELLKPWRDQASFYRTEIDKYSAELPESALRLKSLTSSYGLSSVENDVLILCLLVELDERYRRLCGYLQNDASRQYLNVELVSQILSPSASDSNAVRESLAQSSSLIRHHLVLVAGDPSGQECFSLRPVRLDDRIVSFLTDSDVADGRLTEILSPLRHCSAGPLLLREESQALFERLPESLYIRLREEHESVRILLSGQDTLLSGKIARSLSAALQLPLLEVNLGAALHSSYPFELLIDLAYREACLSGAAILFHSGESLLAAEADRSKWNYVESIACSFTGLTIFAADSESIPVDLGGNTRFWMIDLPLPDYATRKALWTTQLPLYLDSSQTPAQSERLAADLASTFQTTQTQIEDAMATALNLARLESPFATQVAPSHLFQACRRLSGKRLVAYARRIEPRPQLSIADVILPEANKRQLVDLQNRIRFQRELFSCSGLDQSMRLGKGILALFAGSSGTGKTMAAEALASGQGVDLYRIDLSAVVSKWIGETEKNLSRIFAEAENCNGWLFFDEGESLFGSRGDIRQAQDRFLNLEVNYLLQRIEEFSGVVILATNLRNNIDDAFLRRIHAVVEFPAPNSQFRAMIWKKLLPTSVARDFDDLQLRKLANRFEISGGNIRNIVLDAMFRSHAAGSASLQLRHIVDGVAREWQKLGRPILAPEFGEEFYPWVVEDILDPRPIANLKVV